MLRMQCLEHRPLGADVKIVGAGVQARVHERLPGVREWASTVQDEGVFGQLASQRSVVSQVQMQEVLRGTSHLTIKEINLLLRDYVMKYGYDNIKYTSFADDLYDVRFELAKSRLMDINVKKLPNDYFLKSGKPVDSEGKMSMADIKQILFESKELILTPGQIFILLGHANVYHDGTIDAL